MAGGTQHPAKQELSLTEIVDALEASGYPFEVALYKTFADAGMNPVLGQRLRVRAPGADGQSTQVSREIDLVASLHVHHTFDQVVSQGSLVAFIAAKKLHPPSRFVGILSEQPTPHEKRVMRSYFWGCPSLRVLPGHREERYSDLFLSDGGIAQTFDAFADGPVCGHWALARRENSEPRAGGHPPYYDAIESAVAAASYNERDASNYMENLGPDVGQLPVLGVYLPTLIIHTPTLHTYDPHSRTLADVEWLTLWMNFEVAGEVTKRAVDVVSNSGVAAMVDRYRAAGEVLSARLLEHQAHLRGVGYAQRLAAEELRKERGALR